MVCALADSALPLPNRALVVAALNAFLLPTQDAVEVPASTESYQARLACPCHADNPDHQKMQALPYASGRNHDLDSSKTRVGSTTTADRACKRYQLWRTQPCGNCQEGQDSTSVEGNNQATQCSTYRRACRAGSTETLQFSCIEKNVSSGVS